MPYNNNTSWIGVGEKTGGMLAVAGVEDTEGILMNCGNTTNRTGFGIMSVRIGLGLGASTGLVVMAVFNCNNIWRINNTQNNDWGVNLSLGENWAKVAKGLKNMGFFSRVARVGANMAHMGGDSIDEFRNVMHYLYNEMDIATMNSDPKVIVIDTPIGVGLEASVNYSFGTISIY